MINNKIFDHRPVNELFAIVKNDLSKLDSEGLIDDGVLIKTVMHCNDKLGIPIREIREIAIPVENYKAKLPLDLEKIFYVCALNCTNTISFETTNPFDNNFDHDIIYEASLDRQSLGCVDNYQVIVKRESKMNVYNYGSWVQLGVMPDSSSYCHRDCPNLRKPGKHQVSIKNDEIQTPFRSGLLYIMYLGSMKDTEGNILFPFHPLITPWYEWSLKYKVLIDAAFNSDMNPDELKLLMQITTKEKTASWLDAFNFTTDRSYNEFLDQQKRKELSWYNTYFKYFQ